MASKSTPRIFTFKADAAIPAGSAVKLGTDANHVAKSAASTDKSIGIAQNAASAAGDKVEVAFPGGGANGLAQTTITTGQGLVSHTDGSLKPATAANDRVVAIAMDSAVAGDIFPVEVQIYQATATES